MPQCAALRCALRICVTEQPLFGTVGKSHPILAGPYGQLFSRLPDRSSDARYIVRMQHGEHRICRHRRLVRPHTIDPLDAGTGVGKACAAVRILEILVDHPRHLRHQLCQAFATFLQDREVASLLQKQPVDPASAQDDQQRSNRVENQRVSLGRLHATHDLVLIQPQAQHHRVTTDAVPGVEALAAIYIGYGLVLTHVALGVHQELPGVGNTTPQDLLQHVGATQITSVVVNQGNDIGLIWKNRPERLCQILRCDRDHDHADKAPLVEDRTRKLNRPPLRQTTEHRVADKERGLDALPVCLEVFPVGNRHLSTGLVARREQVRKHHDALRVGDACLHQRAFGQGRHGPFDNLSELRVIRRQPRQRDIGGDVVDILDHGLNLQRKCGRSLCCTQPRLSLCIFDALMMGMQ